MYRDFSDASKQRVIGLEIVGMISKVGLVDLI